ncbi:MAG: S9 family peptidase [Alphaproteobacteria bacterium]|nr:S9 family peptidase [Alphaproteobacteria bacterium]
MIFGNPERAGAQISPDGKFFTFLAPRDGVMNIWIVKRGQSFDEARPLTAEKVRPIRQYYWSANGEDVLYVQDKGGDENFLLYSVSAKTGKERKLTDFQGVRVFIYAGSLSRPNELLVGINDRDKAFHDPYLLNVSTGELKKLFDNTEKYDGFVADDSLTIRFVSRATQDGGQEVFKFDNGKTEPFTKIGFEDSTTTGLAGLTSDGKTLYMTESRERNTAALVAIDLASGEKKVLAEDARADIGGTISDPVTGIVLAYAVDYLKNEWKAVDPALQADIDFLNENLKGQWAVQSQTLDNQVWIIGNDPVTGPARALTYDRKEKKLDLLYVGRPKLEGLALPEVCPVEIKSRDGLTLVSYLTLPVGSDTNGDCRPESPLPMVLNVHGGPWARDGYGYNSQSVWLADRGYATLQVNFRGSTGFGKEFTNAGDKQWGRKMHDDLLDGVNWAIAEGIAQKDKVAIYGGSYGGYATLWGITNTPEAFACGVAIVAPSNLNTLLDTIPPYWESFKEQMFRRVGDPRTEDGKALLNERSPLTYVDQIADPLLIGQGANDPRVKQAEADQIVSAMQAKNIPVTYVLYPDEGHGFARPENRTSFYAVSEAFLSQCLGGSFEPVGDDFAGSTITVPQGADAVPGLKDALAAMPKP